MILKFPKRKISILQDSATPILQDSSDEVVANSVTLHRVKAGLHGNPLSVTFKVTSEDGYSWSDTKLEGGWSHTYTLTLTHTHTFTDVWSHVLSELQEARAKLDLPYLSYPPTHVYRQFGLDHPLIVQLLEQLSDAPRCTEYKFQYHKPAHSKHWRALVRYTPSHITPSHAHTQLCTTIVTSVIDQISR